MIEYSSIQLFKLTPLAGPDRLLRIGFTLEYESHQVESDWIKDYDAISYIINGCLLQKHSLTSHIPKEVFFSWIKTEEHNSYDGLIRIELLIRKTKPAEVFINYYSRELELSRKFFEIEMFYKINKEIDPQTYPAPYRLIDLREGNKQLKDTFNVKVKKSS